MAWYHTWINIGIVIIILLVVAFAAIKFGFDFITKMKKQFKK